VDAREIGRFNRDAWDRQVAAGNRWTRPVSHEEVEQARAGRVRVVLTPQKAVPISWMEPIAGSRILCLAGAGGQQAPLLAAAGAEVTVLDNSPAQLAQDRLVADREGLGLTLIEGLMQDLSPLADGSFDLVFHPVSTVFVPDVRPVWREAFRVLRPGGRLLAGLANPVLYVFDDEAEQRGELIVRHTIPYSDLKRSEAEREALRSKGRPLEFGHTLDDLIGGQLDAGFVLTGFYEDRDELSHLNRFLPTYAATCALKPR
jgi:SAM-dependent methyltransferase